MPINGYELLIQKLNTFIKKYYLNKLLRGVIFLGAGLFTAYLAVTLSEYFGNFNTFWRTLLFYLFVAFNIGLIGWLIIPAVLAWLKIGHTLSHDEAARILGRHFSGVNDKLLNTLQLNKQMQANPQSAQLLAASIDQRITELNPVRFPSAINFKQNTRHLKWLLPPAAIICIIAFAAPSVLSGSTSRLINYNKYFAPPAPFEFVILNNNLSAIQGNNITLQVSLKGNKLPDDVYITMGGNAFRLEKQSNSRFNYTISNLQQNVNFILKGNKYQSAPYTITVTQRPSLTKIDAELNYPAYLHKPTETLQNAGDLTIPEGTRVVWHITTQHANNVSIDIDGQKNSMQPEGNNSYIFSKNILKNTAYHLIAINNGAGDATDSSGYTIQTIADAAPLISVQQKADSVSSKALYFNGNIQDDHGFTRLFFKYQRQGKTYSMPVKADLGGTNAGFFYFWDMRNLDIKPGENITYYFEVADNDGVHGPKTARTAERTLTIADEKTMREQIEAGSKAVTEKTESAIKLANQIERESQKLNRMLVEKNDLNFDEKKQVEQLLQKREELNKLLKDIQQQNEKNQYNINENKEQSQQMQQKQQQMAELFKKLIDPKTEEILKKLNELLQNGHKEDTQDELSKMQMDNKSMKKELDRVLDLYKKLLFEQKVDQNIEQLNQLSKEQQSLSEKTNNNKTDNKDLLQQQLQLEQRFDDVKKSLTDLKKEDEESGGKMNFDESKTEQQGIEQQMQNSSNSLQQNNKKQAAEAQKQAAQKMQQLAQKMQQQQQQGEQSQLNINIQQLRELLKNLVNSSFNQEKLMLQLRGMSTQNPAYTALAQQQQDVKDNLKTAQDSLYALSKQVPQIQAAVNKEITDINQNIDKALAAMGDRRTPEATRSQQYAMTAMNNLALLLSEALQRLQNMQNNASSKGGKSQSLSQLTKMQQQLNKNMQQAREQMRQQGKSADGQGMSQQLAKMARQQQMIREALQKLNQQSIKDGNGNGNLDKISKEMEQTENEIVNRNITDETLKRQAQIQSRLLDAERAEQQREQDNRREAKAGNNMPPGYIKALQEYQKQKAKQTEQIRTILPAFNLYYKEKIQSYFEHLNGK